MFHAVFYRDERGREPVQDFIGSLSNKMRQKIAAWVKLLENEGPFLRRPYADKVSGKLYELRIRFASDNVRILYYFFLRDKIILLHGFRKQDWKINPGDIDIAERRMNEFTQRYEQGKVRF